MNYELIGTTIGAALVVIAAGAGVLNRYGLLHFGKRKCPGNSQNKKESGCPDPDCKNVILENIGEIKSRASRMDERVEAIRDQTTKQWEHLGALLEKVSWIKGYLEKRGNQST